MFKCESTRLVGVFNQVKALEEPYVFVKIQFSRRFVSCSNDGRCVQGQTVLSLGILLYGGPELDPRLDPRLPAAVLSGEAKRGRGGGPSLAVRLKAQRQVRAGSHRSSTR